MPRTLFVLLASLALLASTAFLERRNIEGAAATAGESPNPDSRLDRSGEPPQPQSRSGDPARPSGGRTDSESSPAGDGDPHSGLEGINGAGNYDGEEAIQASAELSQLPDRLQDAIRRAFQADPMKEMRTLDGIPDEPARGSGREGRERDERGGESDGASVPSKGDRELRGETQQGSAEQPGLDREQEGKPQDQAGQRRDDVGPHGQRAGSGAGAGMARETFCRDNGRLGRGGGEPTTFKLTLSSFLAAVDSRGLPQWNGKAPAATGGVSDASRGLNDQQLKDDVLRKPEIPAEYEDVVRRTYSVGK
jgi:hypothetical protein